MEGLKKLERVQTTIKFMDSHGILDSDEVSNPDSTLFLANLILLMIQPCGKLDMDVKSNLLVISLSKMPVALLEEASIVLAEAGDEEIENVVLSHPDEKAVSCSLQNDTERISMIGLDAMLRANSTLEDFCRSYFMFHDMEASNVQSLFKHLPLLSFTESYIYQLDHLNEELLQMPSSRNPALEKQTISEENWSWMRKCTEMCNTNPFRPLALLLERRGLLTERINKEFECGQQYWTVERKLCYALINKLEISIEDVMRAIHLKSFDYRVLNLLLYQLRGQKDDVIENSFNILRMFVRIYGASAAPSMLAKIITEAEEKYILLLKALGPELSSKYQRRCEEATCEGGKKSGPPLGTWNIPPVIEDEDLYRSRHLN